MKKVRVLASAAGLAPLALALAPSAAHAATTASNAKTVRIDVTTAGIAHAECGVNAAASGHGAGPIRGVIQYNGSCVGFQQVSIGGHIPGLTERVRFWKNSALLTTKWVNPGTFKTLSNGALETSFKSSPYEHVSMVCEALVANSNHADVKYGPVCERP
jgi:hypothetical protein